MRRAIDEQGEAGGDREETRPAGRRRYGRRGGGPARRANSAGRMPNQPRKASHCVNVSRVPLNATTTIFIVTNVAAMITSIRSMALIAPPSRRTRSRGTRTC